jgi:hypothetical protein
MNSLASRVLAALVGVVVVALLAGAAAKTASVQQPDKLIILSTEDVKGKTSPCG